MCYPLSVLPTVSVNEATFRGGPGGCFSKDKPWNQSVYYTECKPLHFLYPTDLAMSEA